MRIWTLSLAGNQASKRQVVAVAKALQKKTGGKITSFFPEPPAGVEGIQNNTGITWQIPPSVDELRDMGFKLLWPDVVVSCRPEVAALALAVKQASGHKTKIIHIQNPNGIIGNYNLDLADFDMIVRQPQEKFAGDKAPNVIASQMAIHGITPAIMGAWRRNALQVTRDIEVQNPTIVFVGGTDEYVTLGREHYEELAKDIGELARQSNGHVLVLTSRRTSEEGKAILNMLGEDGNVLVDHSSISYQDALAVGERFIITAESMSFISEAMVTEKPCSLYNFGDALKNHPLQPTLAKAVKAGELALYPRYSGGIAFRDELPGLTDGICERLGLGKKPVPVRRAHRKSAPALAAHPA